MSRVKIIDVYKKCNPSATVHLPMLTLSGAYDWLPGYNTAYTILDRYVVERYKSFEVENIFDEDEQTLFYSLFDAFARVNNNKLKELFRMEGLDDSKYSLYNNYDMVETVESSSNSDLGARTDVTKVSPYDTGNFTNTGSQELGAQHNEIEGNQTTTRVGNIGTQTVSDILGKHDELFSRYISFFEKMIDMFAANYFYVGEEEL